MLCTYELKYFSEQLNELKVNDNGINPMYKFLGTKTDITFENHHTQGYPVYVLDARLQGKYLD